MIWLLDQAHLAFGVLRALQMVLQLRALRTAILRKLAPCCPSLYELRRTFLTTDFENNVNRPKYNS